MTDQPAPEVGPSGPPRPLSLGAVFEVGGRVIRRRWRTLLALAIIFQGPAAVISTVVGVRLGDAIAAAVPLGPDGSLRVEDIGPAELEGLFEGLALVLGAGALAGLMAAFAMPGVTLLVARSQQGEDTSLATALRACLDRALGVLGVVVLTTLLAVAVLTVGVVTALLAVALVPPDGSGGGPGVFIAILAGVTTVLVLAYLTVRWLAALPLLELDRGSVLRALRSSWGLTTGNLIRSGLLLITTTIASGVLAALVAQVLGILVVDLVATPAGYGRAAAVATSALAVILVAPILPVMTAVLTLDLRTRPSSPARGESL